MAVVNQYKFVGIDNSTSGTALTPLGSGNPLVSETYVIKSILVTVTTGVPADVTSIDLITIVSLTAGILAPKGVRAAPLVLLSIPTNLYWFTTAINLKRNF